MRWLGIIIDSTDVNFSKLSEIVKDKGQPGVLQSMGSQKVGHKLMTEKRQHVKERQGTRVQRQEACSVSVLFFNLPPPPPNIQKSLLFPV